MNIFYAEQFAIDFTKYVTLSSYTVFSTLEKYHKSIALPNA